MTEVEQIAVLESKVENLKKESAEKTRALFVMSERLREAVASEREVPALRDRSRQLEDDLGEMTEILRAMVHSRGGKVYVSDISRVASCDPEMFLRMWRDEREMAIGIELYRDEPSDEGWYDE